MMKFIRRMLNYRERVNNRGVVMLVALLIMVGLSLLATGVILITTTEVYVTRNEASGKEAFWAAEAGLRHAERIIDSFDSLEDINDIYQQGFDSRCFDYGPEFAGYPDYNRIGYVLTSDAGPVQSDSTFSNDPYIRYFVFIANNYGAGELDENDLRIEREMDGIVLIRAVGESVGGARRILEEKYFLERLIYPAASDMKGGGPGGVPPQ
jgi:hypothetical protein